MPWETVDLAGHPCHLFEPLQPHPLGLVAIYLHGVHQNHLHDKPAIMQEVERHGLRLVCPRTQRSWWSPRICEEFDSRFSAEEYVLTHVVQLIQTRWQVGPPKICLFGTSMGGQGALRLALKKPNLFPVVVAISPAIDFWWRVKEGDETLCQMYRDAEDARQDSATLQLHPLNWPRNIFFCCDPADEPWHDSAERFRSKLNATGIPHECDLETTGGGHGFEYYSRMAPKMFQFLVDRLEAESRRV
jgi:pimeloyl-ACP methyl ester carboxylesterase